MNNFLSEIRMLAATVRIELRKQYAGSFGGLGWICLGPLILLAVYSVVYLLIFQVRAPELTKYEYVLHVFSGLVPFLAFSQALTSSASSIRTDRTLWNEVNVPKWFIPAKSVIVSYAALPVGLAITFLGDAVFSEVTISWLWVIPTMAAQIAFSLGVGFCLSVLTVIILDIQFLLQYATIILLIVTPIAYTVSMVPEKLLVAMAFNPLYHYVTCYQYSILLNKMPPVENLLGAIVPGVVVFILGLLFFKKASGHLSDFI